MLTVQYMYAGNANQLCTLNYALQCSTCHSNTAESLMQVSLSARGAAYLDGAVQPHGSSVHALG